MRKITFLTLVMILGMSSVTFGKSYLCITDEERNLILNPNERIIHEDKFIVKTLGNDKSMISVKEFGKDYYKCLEGSEFGYPTSDSVVEKNTSIKGNTYLTCRTTYLKINGGHIQSEFVLDLERMIFINYFNNYRSSSPSTLTFSVGVTKGKCEEV